MTNKQRILLQLVCAALQGGMNPEDVREQMYEDEQDVRLWDIANEMEDIIFDATDAEDNKIISSKSKLTY